MAIPDSAQGQMLDVNRLLAFKFETPVNVLVLYDERGEEVKRIDHWWHVERPKGSRSRNAAQQRLLIVEDGETLDTALAAADTMRYEVQTDPVTMGEVYEVKVAERPEAGRSRKWVLVMSRPKFKSKHFGTGGVNR